MKKCIIVIFLFFIFSSILAQKNVDQSYKILGEVLGTSNNEDSIFLFEGQINEKYFIKRRLSASLKGEKYELTFKFDEPMMYRFLLLSDTGTLIWRAGRYFIDNTTTSISSN